jgi:hypothetical protein
MNLWGYVKMLVSCLAVTVIVFTVVSLFDILIAVFYARFYSNAAFIVSFGVGGVFGAVLAYFTSIKFAPVKNEQARWFLIITLILTGLLSFFILGKMEGGEYEAAFKAYGATMALGSLLFVKGKVE